MKTKVTYTVKDLVELVRKDLKSKGYNSDFESVAMVWERTVWLDFYDENGDGALSVMEFELDSDIVSLTELKTEPEEVQVSKKRKK